MFTLAQNKEKESHEYEIILDQEYEKHNVGKEKSKRGQFRKGTSEKGKSQKQISGKKKIMNRRSLNIDNSEK